MSDHDDSLPEDHRDAAVTLLVDGRHAAAGDRYTQSGWAELAERGRRGRNTFAPTAKGWAGVGLAQLCVATVCYRAAGREDRARYRGVEGAAVAGDLRGAAFEGVQRAIADEFVGDFRVAAGRDPGGAYERAATTYEEAAPDDPLAHATTPLFEAANATIRQTARGHTRLTWDDLHGPDPNAPDYLARRPRVKARRFPELVDRVVAAGRLHPPRGTTEHGSDDWTCPACGTNEVNWVGGEVVCLDCSTRMERP